MARPSEHVFGDITIKVGTLAVGADANLGAAVGLALGGGTLQFLSGFTSNRAVTLNSGNGTFNTMATTRRCRVQSVALAV